MRKNWILFLYVFIITGFLFGCYPYVEEEGYLDEEEYSEEKPMAGKTAAKTAVPEKPAVKKPMRTAGREFPVYLNDDSQENHYIPSGWMGDVSDIKMETNYGVNPYSKNSCIRFDYSARSSEGKGWAGVYWQNPANNWGESDGGYDLSGYSRVLFYAKGSKGMEKIEFKIGGIKGQYSDSSVASSGVIELTTEWKEYSIDISEKDGSYISGGFCWVAKAASNKGGIVFYLDDIRYSE